MIRHLTCATAVVCGLGFGVEADSITFIHTGTGSGTLNGAPFGPAAFTLRAIADTSNREPLGGADYFIDHDSSEVEITGVGTFQLITGTRTFKSGSLVGYSRAGADGVDLFNGSNSAAFSSWDMLGPIGPVASNASLIQWDRTPIETSGGTLVFDHGQSAATFEAAMGGGPCDADCDTSTGRGVLDIFDFLCFGNLFSANDPYACDCDTNTGVGVCDIFDFLCFGNEFSAGCP